MHNFLSTLLSFVKLAIAFLDFRLCDILGKQSVPYFSLPPFWLRSRKLMTATHYYTYSFYFFECHTESFPSYFHIVILYDLILAYPINSNSKITRIVKATENVFSSDHLYHTFLHPRHFRQDPRLKVETKSNVSAS